MKHISPKTIHLWTAKNSSFYARLSPHAIKIIRHLAFWTHRYFRRLFKEITLIVPLFLLLLIVVNLKTPKNSFDILKENVQINLADSNSHLLLANKFISANQYSFAQNELTQTAGNRANEINEIEVLKDEPVRIQKEILLWQQSTNMNPSYRDGYIKLAILNWKLYRPFDSSKYLSLAKQIDPNNSNLKKFEDSLK